MAGSTADRLLGLPGLLCPGLPSTQRLHMSRGSIKHALQISSGSWWSQYQKNRNFQFSFVLLLSSLLSCSTFISLFALHHPACFSLSQGVDSIVIAKTDATANDYPAGFSVASQPQHLCFSAPLCVWQGLSIPCAFPLSDKLEPMLPRGHKQAHKNTVKSSSKGNKPKRP